MCIINIAKIFTCDENFDGSEQPWKHKVAATQSATTNSKIIAPSKNTFQNISEKIMWIDVNSCEFMDNKWCFNNKKCFYCY